MCAWRKSDDMLCWGLFPDIFPIKDLNHIACIQEGFYECYPAIKWCSDTPVCRGGEASEIQGRVMNKKLMKYQTHPLYLVILF